MVMTAVKVFGMPTIEAGVADGGVGKASELSSLCGAETAIVVGESSTIEPSFGDYYRSANINEFNRQVTEAMIPLEEEEEQGKKLTEI
ncbi:hypothetical protein BVC80_7205g1 [Macleaya cordata]|uniref:Uncharacterized protein n=1 Tax=Macleaya cordata TaxID=56857 RepID=A0A200PV37_MACCD|nr:hypothetical protein BVC80_7205g1 [Macleaya cordata]